MKDSVYATSDMTGTERVTSVLADKTVRNEIAAIVDTGRISPVLEFNASARAIIAQLEKPAGSASDAEYFSDRQVSEAIILATGRPVLFIKDGLVEKAGLPSLEATLSAHRKKLATPIKSIGRVELLDHDDFQWVGTGWRVEDDFIVTNRHVASVFAQRQGRQFVFRTNRSGRSIRAKIDFLEEYRVAESAEVNVAEVVWMAQDADDAPDMAILKVIKDASLPRPLQLSAKDASLQDDVAAVGYPARDGSRNDPDLMAKIFGDVYDVKRFAPGKVVSLPERAWHLTHDCSTLGGMSGSALLGISTGHVVGLHFGGRFRQTNFAVKSSVVKGILARRQWMPVRRQELGLQEAGFSETVRTKAELQNRKGFDDRFLGVSAPMPTPGKTHQVLNADGAGRLDYAHFSIVMSKTRRMAIVAAVNIDGARKIKLKRVDSWGFDPRIAKAAQIGHSEFYGPEAFDKGHMVRREDPGWGDSTEEAQAGERDSFVYTNAVPQMPQLNQVTWLSLEDYVLSNAKSKGLQVSVYTGPVLSDDDTTYTNSAIAVPTDFYKVVAMLDADTNELVVSAYMLSQEGMMPQEGFRYGPFKTYQVPLSKVEGDADIRFSPTMRKADVFAGDPGLEMTRSARFVEITGPQDIVLSKPKV